MRHSIRLFIYFLIYLFVYFISPSSVGAVGEFQADYDVGYVVAPSGITTVTQNIILTNNLSNLYPQKYAIIIDSTKIKNVIAHDKKGVITPSIIQANGKTEIVLPFNDHVAGLGKKLNFTLRYESEDIAQKNGSIWEVTVPGVPTDPALGSYTVSLDVPTQFGPNAYMSPLPGSGRRWTKEQLMSGGITAAYGESQVFSLDLSYHLENTSGATKIQEIVLPPDTAFQKVTIESISPPPATISRTDEGNWVAQYELTAKQVMDIQVNVYVNISIKPRETYARDVIRREDYLKPDKYWEVADPSIIALAAQYTTPREIYEYVVGTLGYDYSRVSTTPTRKGAVSALTNPKNSICTEFTDLFIAIARAAGIPTREVVGYAYTTNAVLRPLSLVTDVLHAWPEYYDESRGLWVPIDPTWANTTRGLNYFDKLDFNHIVFAIHGVRSDLPYPAGFYRKAGKSGKDVQVAFADPVQFSARGKLNTRIEFPKNILAGFTGQGNVSIENVTGVSIDEAKISVAVTPYPFSITKTERHITPFAKVTIPVAVGIDNFFARRPGEIVVTVNDEITRVSFNVWPVYLYSLPALMGVGAFGFLGWYLWRRFKKR